MEELSKKKENRRLYSDIQSDIHIAKKSSFHLNTKHIHLKYHSTISILEYELLNFEKIHTSQNLVDMLTKVVTREKMSSYSVYVGLQA